MTVVVAGITGAEFSAEDGLLVKRSPGGLAVVMRAMAGPDKAQAFDEASFYRSGVGHAAVEPAKGARAAADDDDGIHAEDRLFKCFLLVG